MPFSAALIGVARRINHAAPHFCWREVAIVVIKAVHSGIFLLNAISVLHVFWVGVLNRRCRVPGSAADPFRLAPRSQAGV
jgi:hypothetical protein